LKKQSAAYTRPISPEFGHFFLIVYSHRCLRRLTRILTACAILLRE
jgi:hypothetical protein